MKTKTNRLSVTPQWQRYYLLSLMVGGNFVSHFGMPTGSLPFAAAAAAPKFKVVIPEIGDAGGDDKPPNSLELLLEQFEGMGKDGGEDASSKVGDLGIKDFAIDGSKLERKGFGNGDGHGHSDGLVDTEISKGEVSGEEIQPSGEEMSLSQYGLAMLALFEEYTVERGDTWDICPNSNALDNWIVQHPPTRYLGQSSSMLPVAEECDSGDNCDSDFHLKKCTVNSDCGMKQLCEVQQDSGPVWGCPNDSPHNSYFEPGMCVELDSTQTSTSSGKEKLCVGHSYELYERMYNHIIQAQRFVDITSLDSFDSVGTAHSSGLEFMAVIRNAVTYLANTGREITIRLHFGSVTGNNENVQHIAEQLTRDTGSIAGNQVDLHVTTYHLAWQDWGDLTPPSWNHGKIIAIDGDKLFTGGTNYYSSHYLWEDPVSDVDLQVQGLAAVTAHTWANKLHKAACKLQTSTTGSTSIDYAWRTWDGQPHYSDVEGCPPEYDSTKQRQSFVTPGSGFTIIPTARLGSLATVDAPGISNGQKTSDLAMYSMITTASESVKISQQDILPIYMYGIVTTVMGNAGYSTDSSTGIAVFDDTWRLIEAVAKALAKNVRVSMMLSAPCAIGADPEGFASQESVVGNTEKCPEDGTQGIGYDYWARVYSHHNDNWPEKRDVDLMPLFLPPEGNPLVEIFSQKAKSDHRKLTGGGYGYGWSLDNNVDWIYAYFAIFPENRPIDQQTGDPISDGEVVNLICDFLEVGHVRMTKDEETYVRISKEDPSRVFRGGQIGNHAKVVMADDSIFYVGSDNMYGAGLAEFGLVVDDQERSAQFAAEYFGPRWNELLGTQEKPGLVTGTSRVVNGCPWKERLPVRPKPWSDINLVLSYGDKAYLEQAVHEQHWIGNDEGSLKTSDARNWLGQLNALDMFKWTFRSQLNDGSRLSPDPMAGSCVKYGDVVYLQANNEDSMWLGGSLPGIEASIIDYSCGTGCYQWIVRSSTDIGEPGSRSAEDQRAGQCVSEKDNIYLQINSVDGHWLSGSSSDDHVFASGGTEWTTEPEPEYYRWTIEMSPDNLGTSCEIDAQCDSGRCSSNYLCEPKVATGERCLDNDDCISGRCDSRGHILNRQCITKAGEFSSCNENSDCFNDECTWGFICGQQCLFSSSCDSDQYCSSRFTCEPKLETGASCLFDESCASAACNYPLFTCGEGCLHDGHCDEATETCDYRHLICIPKGEEGEFCLEDDDCAETHGEGSGCSWAATCGHTCWSDDECESERCSRNLICEPKLSNGAWCGFGNDCQSGRCNIWFTCIPKAENGESCSDDIDCASNNCSDSWWGNVCEA